MTFTHADALRLARHARRVGDRRMAALAQLLAIERRRGYDMDNIEKESWNARSWRVPHYWPTSGRCLPR